MAPLVFGVDPWKRPLIALIQTKTPSLPPSQPRCNPSLPGSLNERHHPLSSACAFAKCPFWFPLVRPEVRKHRTCLSQNCKYFHSVPGYVGLTRHLYHTAPSTPPHLYDFASPTFSSDTCIALHRQLFHTCTILHRLHFHLTPTPHCNVCCATVFYSCTLLHRVLISLPPTFCTTLQRLPPPFSHICTTLKRLLLSLPSRLYHLTTSTPSILPP